jgi:cyclic pyranopterin phosphate synthase
MSGGKKPGFTHLDGTGAARMVDVGAKPASERVAIASARVTMTTETARAIAEQATRKGDVLATARIAGIMAAKRTAELIPLCHPLPLSAVELDLACDPAAGRMEISATVRTTGPTGVEMEALTAASVAALTVYDMCKSMDRSMTIGPIQLDHKSGGKSGTYDRE